MIAKNWLYYKSNLFFKIFDYQLFLKIVEKAKEEIMCFKKRKKDLQSTLIKFTGRNEDLVWTSPEISGLYEGKK